MNTLHSQPPPLSIQALSKTYISSEGSHLTTLQDINLDIHAGEFLVIVGPSGCGKSTLLNILAGLEHSSSGHALAYGQPITQPDIDRGMVFQSYALFPWLSVRANVEFGLEQRGLDKKQRRTVALEYLQLVGLAEFAEKHIHELSGGMKQRVAIARAFAINPSIILMDEPFGALDALTRRFLQGELLRIWRSHQKTIVFITHSVPEAIFLGSRIIVMTARPAQIKTEVSVELPHPRDISSDTFRALERQLYAQLDEEVALTFQSKP